jgi:precorrin-2 dehydrogenase/sirohydrochlorin ferrochelatase
MAKRYYPAFLDIEGAVAVVVGGGEVAAAKVQALLDSGARVTVISPRLAEPLAALAQSGAIAWAAREFAARDLSGARVVIAATDAAEVNTTVAQEGRAQGALVNVVDNPEQCDFIAPAVVRRGALTIAVGTSGTSPAMARRVREEIEALFPKEYGALLEVAGRVRNRLKAEGRRAPPDAWQRALSADVLALVREGRTREAEEALMRLLEAHPALSRGE